jgi:flagellar protein FlaF
MSLMAYTRVQRTTGTPRENEYRLFADVTRGLIEAGKSGARDKTFFDALDWNRRLWSTLSTDCSSPGNKLPKQVRAQIISISIWVSKYTSMVALDRAEIGALIDINRTIMEGLAAQNAPQPTAQSAHAAAV